MKRSQEFPRQGLRPEGNSEDSGHDLFINWTEGLQCLAGQLPVSPQCAVGFRGRAETDKVGRADHESHVKECVPCPNSRENHDRALSRGQGAGWSLKNPPAGIICRVGWGGGR